MTTRTETILPDTPTYLPNGGIDYSMHCGWTMEVTDKDPNYYTDTAVYPDVIRTGPSSLITEQAGYAQTTFTINGGPVYAGVVETWYPAPFYYTAFLNGVKYLIKHATSIAAPTQIYNYFVDAGYQVTTP